MKSMVTWPHKNGCYCIWYPIPLRLEDIIRPKPSSKMVKHLWNNPQRFSPKITGTRYTDW